MISLRHHINISINTKSFVMLHFRTPIWRDFHGFDYIYVQMCESVIKQLTNQKNPSNQMPDWWKASQHVKSRTKIT